ncbi:hypothetical protein Tco_1518581, partial [Tanacetum coccineum]
MMLLSCSPTHSSIQLALNSSVVTISSAPSTCCSMNFVQMTSHPVLVGKTWKFSVAEGKSYSKLRAINPRRDTSTTHGGNWEDPDGSDSEMEEDEEGEENNLDFESDWEEEEADVSESSSNIKGLSASQIEEHLIK